MFRSIWPVEERPEELQREAWVDTISPADFLMMKKCWEEQQKRDDKGEEMFRKDAVLPTVLLDGGPDNCRDLLHNGRYRTYVTYRSRRIRYT